MLVHKLNRLCRAEIQRIWMKCKPSLCVGFSVPAIDNKEEKGTTQKEKIPSRLKMRLHAEECAKLPLLYLIIISGLKITINSIQSPIIHIRMRQRRCMMNKEELVEMSSNPGEHFCVTSAGFLTMSSIVSSITARFLFFSPVPRVPWVP